MTDSLQTARTFMSVLPHARALGLQIVDLGNGRASVIMPWDARFVGDPVTGVIHGGAVSALMDTASGAAVMCHPAGPLATATLGLRIDYMRPATPGHTLRATAECYHVTRSVAFVRVITTDEDVLNPVATATGAFTIEGVVGAMP